MSAQQLHIDALGQDCPWPLVLCKQSLLTMSPGATLTIEVSDPMAELDLRALCAREGHRWVSITPRTEGGAWTIELAKRTELS